MLTLRSLTRGAFVIALAGVGAWVLPNSAGAATRHHISFGMGYAKLLSKDLEKEASTIFSTAGSGQLAYRLTLNPRLDLTFVSCAEVSTDPDVGNDLKVTDTFMGPGSRWNIPWGPFHPYLETNVFFAEERIEYNFPTNHNKTLRRGPGGRVAHGMEIPLTSSLSVPIEVRYVYANLVKKDFNTLEVSSLGMMASLAFNFGATKK